MEEAFLPLQEGRRRNADVFDEKTDGNRKRCETDKEVLAT